MITILQIVKNQTIQGKNTLTNTNTVHGAESIKKCVQAVFYLLTATEKHIIIIIIYWSTGSVFFYAFAC